MTFRTYGNLAYQHPANQPEGHWLMTSLEPHVAIRLKHIFPKISKTQTDNFLFDHSEINCADLDWFCDRYPLNISAADLKILKGGLEAFQTTQAELERILLPDYTPRPYIGLNPGFEVRPYQSQAVDILMLRKSLLLGDDMGLGKTYTAAAAMLRPGVLPVAVVVQTHLQKQWRDKITEFTNLTVHIVNTTKVYDLPKADVYIYKYTQLAGWVSIFATKFFKMVVYDEIQELRTGEDSAKGRGAYVLSNNTVYRMGLSGTPAYNYGTEMYNILRAIDPTVLGERSDFLREWSSDGHKKITDPKAFGTYLRECHVFLRRTKDDVGQQMPPINRIVEIVETNHKVLDDMNKLAKTLALKVVNGSFSERGQAARELDLLARHATGVAKAKSVAAYVRILLESDIPVVLAGWHRDVYDIWQKELAEFKPAMYTGTESPKEKQKSVDDFLSGKTNLFIISLRSGAGLDGLQARASFVVFGELDWSGEIHAQLIARLYREGQKVPVTAIFLQSEEGSDPPMIDLLGVKASQVNGIIDPLAPLKTVHSDMSRVKALCAQFLSKAAQAA
jgi:SNF2 family DNA or RNA helicase